MKEGICKKCGNSYILYKAHNGYCNECRMKMHKCPQCGGWKDRTESRLCSKCSLTKRICDVCGKEFISNINGKKYCSDKCSKIGKARHDSARHFKKPRIKICRKCGNEFEIYRGHNNLCRNCLDSAHICPECGGKKNIGKSHCMNCSLLFRNNSGLINKSKINDKRYDFFVSNGFNPEKEFCIKNTGYKHLGKVVYYDFKIGKYLIEIDPTFTHNSTKITISNRGLQKKPQPELYCQEKSLLGYDNGYHVIHIFDNDNIEFIKEWLIGLMSKRKRLYSKDIRIVNPKEANEFCDKNHLQGRGPSTVRYGLYVNGELINLLGMLYQNGEWNLNRFCSKRGYYIAHGADKLLKRFIQDYNPEWIISFSDITKHSGGLYDALGFEMREIQQPSYRRVYLRKREPGKQQRFRRRECQKGRMHNLPGFDKSYRQKGHKNDLFRQQTEKQLMASHGYVKMCDSGMRKHVRFRDTNSKIKWLYEESKKKHYSKTKKINLLNEAIALENNQDKQTN